MRICSNDADGCVQRRLDSRKFDSSQPTLIYFNVEFERWPPPRDAVITLSQMYGNLTIHEPQNGIPGDIAFQIYDRFTYQLVIHVQGEVNDSMASFAGRCARWGVWHRDLSD